MHLDHSRLGAFMIFVVFILQLSLDLQLEAEYWLAEMEDLLRAVWIPKENKVDGIKIQLTDVARSWWQAEGH